MESTAPSSDDVPVMMVGLIKINKHFKCTDWSNPLPRPSQISMSASPLEGQSARPSGARTPSAPTAASRPASRATGSHRRATVWVSLSATHKHTHTHNPGTSSLFVLHQTSTSALT